MGQKRASREEPTLAQVDHIEVRIGFDQQSKDRMMRDIDDIRARLIRVAREQERVIANAERLRDLEGDS